MTDTHHTMACALHHNIITYYYNNRLLCFCLFGLLLSFVCLIVLFYSLDICCRCTVLFLHAYTRVVIV